MAGQDFQIEKRLHTLDPHLHKRFSDALIALHKQLENYRAYFPEYTDHTDLHVLTVVENCNRLIREQDVERLSADELYILLMSCYLHDVGMGIREKDYEPFCRELGLDDHPDVKDSGEIPQFIRKHHHEFSGCYIRKYADLLDLPSEEHTFAIVQVGTGHRKTDLFDPGEYPEAMPLPGGKTACLPYLAAILRLADELDVAVERNPMILYDVSQVKDAHQVFEFKKHTAVRSISIDPEAVALTVDPSDREVYDGVAALVAKMQEVTDYCVEVTDRRTPYRISQRRILIRELAPEGNSDGSGSCKGNGG